MDVIDKISSLKTEASSRLIFLWDAAVSSPRFYFYCEVSLASLEDHCVFALQLSAHPVEAEITGAVSGIGNNGKPRETYLTLQRNVRWPSTLPDGRFKKTRALNCQGGTSFHCFPFVFLPFSSSFFLFPL